MSAFDDNPFGQPTSPEITYGVKSTTAQPVNTTINPFSEDVAEIPTTKHEEGKLSTSTFENSFERFSGTTPVNFMQQDTNYDTKPIQEESPNKYKANEVASTNIFTVDINRRDNLEREYESLDVNDTTSIVRPNVYKRNNFPPFPKWTKIKPCFYHDIDADIPFQYQRAVKSLYRIWVGYVLVLSLNLMDGLIALFIGFSDDNGKAVGLALFYWIFCIPSSFVCWFRPAYKAFRNDGSIRFMLFFFVFSAQCGFSIFISLGIGDIGAFGWVNGIDQFTKGEAKNYFFGACCLLTGLSSSFIATCSVYMIIKIHKLYRYSGNSISKAKDEIVTGLSSNKTFQDATISGAANLVTRQSQNQPQRG